jgi:uncharacterized protein
VRRSVVAVRAVAVAVILLPVHLWRATAVMRQPRCRFYPSCSTYAVEALQVHGPARGSALAAGRLLRCHPWSPGGVDRVPPARVRVGVWGTRIGSSAQVVEGHGPAVHPTIEPFIKPAVGQSGVRDA